MRYNGLQTGWTMTTTIQVLSPVINWSIQGVRIYACLHLQPVWRVPYRGPVIELANASVLLELCIMSGAVKQSRHQLNQNESSDSIKAGVERPPKSLPVHYLQITP